MRNRQQAGITLIETIVFVVVISLALLVLVRVFSGSALRSADPAVRLAALERSQALLDDILARKFDENTPTGGVPACGTSASTVCAGIAPEGGFDDVGDFHGYTTTFSSGYNASVSVVEAGAELGLSNSAARRVTVRVSAPLGETFVLSAYKVNF